MAKDLQEAEEGPCEVRPVLSFVLGVFPNVAEDWLHQQIPSVELEVERHDVEVLKVGAGLGQVSMHTALSDKAHVEAVGHWGAVEAVEPSVDTGALWDGNGVGVEPVEGEEAVVTAKALSDHGQEGGTELEPLRQKVDVVYVNSVLAVGVVGDEAKVIGSPSEVNAETDTRWEKLAGAHQDVREDASVHLVVVGLSVSPIVHPLRGLSRFQVGLGSIPLVRVVQEGPFVSDVD